MTKKSRQEAWLLMIEIYLMLVVTFELAIAM